MKGSDIVSEFTKGKWQTVFFKGMNEQEMYIKVSGGACICKILDRPSAEKKANARLIASAPDLKQQRDDLLELCKEFMEKADNGSADFDDPAPGSIYLRADAIIKKAQS